MTANQITSLMESIRSGSLGTLAENGTPFVSLVGVAVTGPRTMAMLLSGLAVHSKNLDRNASASLLLIGSDSEGADPLSGSRVTLTGTVQRLERQNDQSVRMTFLAKHKSAEMYADFGDFAFYELNVDQAHLVAGFGKIATVSGDELT